MCENRKEKQQKSHFVQKVYCKNFKNVYNILFHPFDCMKRTDLKKVTVNLLIWDNIETFPSKFLFK